MHMKSNSVLLLDDDPDTVSLYKLLVRKLGYSDWFTTAYRGKEALEYLERCEAFPEVLIVDINMDEMSGFEFVQEFEKRFYNQNSNSRVIILSSSVRESDRKKALSFHSVEEFISKPISRTKLKTFFTGEFRHQS